MPKAFAGTNTKRQNVPPIPRFTTSSLQRGSWLVRSAAHGIHPLLRREKPTISEAFASVLKNDNARGHSSDTVQGMRGILSGNNLVLPRPIPGFAAKFFFGEMADALLLSNTRVIPKKLAEAGYVFKHNHLKTALEDILK